MKKKEEFEENIEVMIGKLVISAAVGLIIYIMGYRSEIALTAGMLVLAFISSIKLKFSR